jgi:starch synthase
MKTGGLADVSAALPAAIKQNGHDVRIIMPAYRDTLQLVKTRKLVAEISLPGTIGTISLLETCLPDTSIPVYLVDYPNAFDREGNPYVDRTGEPWPDNAERFSLFSKVITEVAQNRADLEWQPNVLHCNDWQTALAPALLHLAGQRPATVFTIHNLAYQGNFPYSTFTALGLPPELWSPESLEFHGQISFIKGGIVFSDRVTTVSPNYAKEIQTPVFGFGLEGLLKHQSQKLSGILNGIDASTWNPANDPNLTQCYDLDSIENKKLNKTALQEVFRLETDSSKLLFGFIGRLVEQKGIDFIIKLASQLVNLPVQLVILGTGDQKIEKDLQTIADKHPSQIACKIGYSESLSHKIEAGCDVFLMPSRFEPCGLNQMYSLRYGTIPIVNNVGGLSDTVTSLNKKGSNLKQATGFVMKDTSSDALYDEIIRAMNSYQNPDTWKTLVANAMKKDFTWKRSANDYLKLYKHAISTNELNNEKDNQSDSDK